MWKLKNTYYKIIVRNKGGNKMVTKFVLNETSYFGKGAREVLPEEIQKRGFKKILLVSDKS